MLVKTGGVNDTMFGTGPLEASATFHPHSSKYDTNFLDVEFPKSSPKTLFTVTDIRDLYVGFYQPGTQKFPGEVLP